MQEGEKHEHPQPEKKEGMSLKTKLVIAGVGLVGTIGLVVWIDRTRKQIAANKSDRKSFSANNPETKAKLIKMTFENDGNLGTDIPALRQIMRSLRSQEEYDAIATEYEIQNNPKGLVVKHTLNNDMKEELQTSELKEMMAIKEGKPLKAGQPILLATVYKQWANRLKAAFEKQYSFIKGTDEGAIHAVIQELRTQKDFTNTGAFYRVQFGTDLVKDLQSELAVWEYPSYMRMIKAKPKG